MNRGLSAEMSTQGGERGQEVAVQVGAKEGHCETKGSCRRVGAGKLVPTDEFLLFGL